MGTPKALLSSPDGTWLDRTLNRLRGAGADPLLVAGGEVSWVRPPATHVPDRRPGEGPLAGIEAAMERGLAEGGAGWWLVLACDLPRLQEPSLRTLLDARSSDLSAVVARGPSGLEPLIACYHTSILEPLAAYLDGPRRSARGFVESLGPRALAVDLPPEVLFNANTPRDVEGL